jgi:hypothetical protein
LLTFKDFFNFSCSIHNDVRYLETLILRTALPF